MKTQTAEDKYLYDGGDDNVEEDEQPEKKDNSKEARYKERAQEFKILDCGMNAETGMNFERGCTDIICVGLFLAFIGAMFGTLFWGVVSGDPMRMVQPYDYMQNICGVDEAVKDYPNLYFTKLAPSYTDLLGSKQQGLVRAILFENSVCVKSCPDKMDQNLECPNIDNGKYRSKCGVKSVKTRSVFGMCMPRDLHGDQKANWGIVNDYLKENSDIYMTLLNISTASTSIMVSVGTALVLCIIYIYFMSIAAEYLAWALVFLTQIGFIVLAVGGFYVAATVKDPEIVSGGKSGGSLASTGLTFGIIFSIAAIIFAIGLWCGWRSLSIAIEMINSSADFLAQTKRIFIVPFSYNVILILFIFFWLACVISVNCLGTINPDPSTGGVGYVPFKKTIKWDGKADLSKTVDYIIIFLSFGLVWITFFLRYSSNYVIMVTAATYYFTCKPTAENEDEQYGSGQMAQGWKWAWVNNFGSIAYGSLLIAIIWTVKVIVYYLFKRLENASGENAAIKCLSCAVMCFLNCLEEFIDYINNAAYAYMAISGENFCMSAYHGILLQMKHAGKFIWGEYLAEAFIFIGKLGITVLNTMIIYIFMNQVTGSASKITSPYGPLIAVGLTTYAVVSIFLGLFDESVLAIMTCASADMDLHGGDPEWGPPTLTEVIEKLYPAEERHIEYQKTAEGQDAEK